MTHTMDNNDESDRIPNFQNLRAKFEQRSLAISASSSPSELCNVEKAKKLFDSNNHDVAQNVVRDWKHHASHNSASVLKKSSSELIRRPLNGDSLNVQQIIERLNNSNIPLTGSLRVPTQKDANESTSNASTSNLSEISEDAPTNLNNRSNSFVLYGTMPKQIIEEMKASGHFKKIPSVRSNLPESVGQVRAQRTRRAPAQPPISTVDSWCSSPPISICLNDDPNALESERPTSRDSRNNPVSFIGSSSTSSDDTYFETYEYYGSDEKENRRCAELHGVVYEICCRQRTFLRLLTNICKELVPFIKKIDEKSSHKAFVESSSGIHILDRLSRELEPILGIHRALYEEFSKTFSNWSALTPNFATIFVRNADFLKICSGFLKNKKDLTDELITAMEQNKYLAQTIRLFEDEVLNAPDGGINVNNSMTSISQAGGISLVMHLDNVHQNIVRYILLMERYRKLLPSDIDECKKADEAIRKLKVVSEAINESLIDPEYTEKLMDIYRKVSGKFNVLSPSRRLIHEGRLKKQSRKEEQERHLILFSDYILLCRYAYPWDYFDAASLYEIYLPDVEVQVKDHFDHELEFFLISPKKSATLIAASKKERDFWVEIIKDTRNKWMENQRRLQEQRRKISLANPDLLDDKTPTDPNISFLTLKDQTPTNGDSSKGTSKNVLPVWIPNREATKCMMFECGFKFTTIVRRHHCRQCGLIICNKCSAKAPVKFMEFSVKRVCSECYDKILDDFINLTYFPPNMICLTDPNLANKIDLKKSSKNTEKSELIESLRKDPFSDTIRIIYDNGARSMHPRDLFKEPKNKHYHRAQQTNSIANDSGENEEVMLLISSKILLTQKKGNNILRWAKLDSNYSLNLYEAELDATPVDTVLIYGYNVFIDDNLKTSNGAEFTLLHQNQVKTERKDLKLVFRVENKVAADRWQDALINKLKLPLLSDISNN